jgi:predicted permease
MLDDLRFAIRMLRKNPGFTCVAILSLGIGIGANSGIYSFADALLMRPLPVLKPSEVVTVNSEKTGMFGASSSISYPDYVDLRDHNRTFEGLIASNLSSFGFAKERTMLPKMKFGMFVSGNFFQVLGVRPELGRTFRSSEDVAPGRDAVAILSHEFWTEDFGADPSVVGQRIRLNGTEFTVVGVAPPEFKALGQLKPAFYIPIAMSPSLGPVNNLTKRDARWLDVKGRLKPGVGLEQAKADVASIVAGLRSMYLKTDENLRLKVETEFQTRAERSPPDTALIAMLGVLALCVLLVACANVAGLLLSRASARAREISVRQALGASRVALVRQLMLENLLLALGGGVAGIAVAAAAVQLFRSIPVPTDLPLDFDIRLDDRVLLFTLCAAAGSTFLFGLAPALQSTAIDLMRSLKERDGTASRVSRLWGRSAIVAGQVALSLVLLIISAVLVQGFRSQLEQGPGFRTDHLQLMTFDPGLVQYSDDQRILFYQQLLERAQQAPGVKSAALTSSIPIGMGNMTSVGVIPEGRELKRGEHAFDTFDALITPDFFSTMAIPLVQGRAFLPTDKKEAAPVAIVNEQFAHHYWPKQDAIGKRIRLNDESGKLVEVVGIAKNAKYLWITEGPTDFVYLPFSQNDHASMTLVAQTDGAASTTLVPVLQQAVQGLDRNMPVFDVRSIENVFTSRAVATPRIITRTVGAMGLMGLILSIVGLYGVVSYSVSKRSREFGIRMAVGADRWTIVRMVLRQGLVLGMVGLAVGLVVGVFASEAMTATLLFSFPVGAVPIVLVSALLLAAVIVSAYGPARRASLIDPMRALREE